MENDLIAGASHAIEILAERDGVSKETIRGYIQEAITEARKDPSPQTELLWKSMADDGKTPSPEELIAWVASLCIL